jgi:RNA-directed DNA polymerase
MTLNNTEQMAETPSLAEEVTGQNPVAVPCEVLPVTAGAGSLPSEADRDLMSAVLARSNMLLAYDRVRRNKGAPGVDGMTVEALKPYLKTHWPEIKQQLLEGRYTPQPVRKVEIPKPGGGTRMLGIPCVLDRLIQQALHQVLSPRFEPTFSDHSYGFRPGRSAAQAVLQARSYMEEGRRWVVDIDLEAFFDRVNHDILMGTSKNLPHSTGSPVIASSNH